MSDREFNEIKMEQIARICREHFNVNLQVNQLIIPDVPTKNNTHTTVFKSGNIVYALCEAETPITFGQVRSIIKQMEMDADVYYPPRRDSDYFTRFARHTFRNVFPGREVVSLDDLRYYQTLAPYSPALIRIRKVNGQIRRYNTYSGNWQKIINFSYFRPQVQLQ